MTKDDRMMVKLLVRGFTILSRLTRCFETPRGMGDAINFTAANLDRISASDDPKTWESTRLKRDVPIDTLTDLAIQLVWFANKFALQVNAIRQVMGYLHVDWNVESGKYEKEHGGEVE